MEDITRQALEWNPQGKWSRGRPKNTWRRTVLEEAKGMKKLGQRLSATRRIECGGGFLWTPYVPQRNDGTTDWLNSQMRSRNATPSTATAYYNDKRRRQLWSRKLLGNVHSEYGERFGRRKNKWVTNIKSCQLVSFGVLVVNLDVLIP
jgi:hypothetical protein